MSKNHSGEPQNNMHGRVVCSNLLLKRSALQSRVYKAILEGDTAAVDNLRKQLLEIRQKMRHPFVQPHLPKHRVRAWTIQDVSYTKTCKVFMEHSFRKMMEYYASR